MTKHLNNLPYVKTGSYTGDGNDDKTISELTFQPKIVFIINSESTDYYTIVKTDTMLDNKSKPLSNSAMLTDCIKTLTSNGFTLGTNGAVNTNGVLYYYFAIGGVGVTTSTYTGDGEDEQLIYPDVYNFCTGMIAVFPDSNKSCFYRTYLQDDNIKKCCSFAATSTLGEQITQVVKNNWFVVAKSVSGTVNLNANEVTYHYWGIEKSVNSIGIGAYTGDGVNDRIMSMPENIKGNIVWINNSNNRNGVFSLSNMGDNKTCYWIVSGMNEDLIKDVDSINAKITVSDDSIVNENMIWHDIIVFEENHPMPASYQPLNSLMLKGVGL